MDRFRFVAGILVVGLLPVAANAGQWQTSEGTMTLPDAPNSMQIYAPYSQDGGRVIGQMTTYRCLDCGATITGFWVEKSSGEKCASARDGSYHWGRLEFEFDPEYISFDGKWSYCDANPSRSWTGKAN